MLESIHKNIILTFKIKLILVSNIMFKLIFMCSIDVYKLQKAIIFLLMTLIFTFQRKQFNIFQFLQIDPFIIIFLLIPSNSLRLKSPCRAQKMHQNTIKKNFSKNRTLSYSSVRDLKQKMEQINQTSRVKKRPSLKDSVSYSRVSLFDFEKQDYPTLRNEFSMIDIRYPFKKNQQQRVSYQNLQKFEDKSSYQKSPSTTFGSQTGSFFDLKRVLNKKDIVWKNKNGDLKTVNKQDYMQVMSNDFLSSFKIVFNQLIETYFLQIYLKKKIRYLTFQIWSHILKSAGPTYIQKRQNLNTHQIDIKVVFNALKNVFPNEFRPSQIQQAIKIYFPSKTHVSYADFQILMSFERDIMDFLVERSYEHKYGSISPTKLINTFLKTLIQYADFEKKLRMISRENSNQLISFLINMSKDQVIQVLKFANFLDESENYLPYGMRQTETKISNFFETKLSKRCSKFEFLKWLKIEQKLLR